MSVLLPKNVDIKKIKYSEVKVLKSGAKSIYTNYDGGKLMIQTPVLTIPYGINDNAKFMDKKGDKPDDKKYDLTLSFRGMDENPKIKIFYDKLREVEDKMIEDAYQNRQLWFKNAFNNNKDVVATMFTPIVKMDKDRETGQIANKYPPTFKVKIPYDPVADTFAFDAYDMENNEVNFHNILNSLKGGKCQLIIQLNGIWIGPGLFGTSWKIVSGKFQQSNMCKPVFLQDSDTEKAGENDDDDEIEVDTEVVKNAKKPSLKIEVPVSKPAEPVKKAPVPVPVEEEDEADEEEADEEEASDAEEASEQDDDDIEPEEPPKPPTPVPSPPPTPPPAVVKPAVKKAVKKVAK